LFTFPCFAELPLFSAEYALTRSTLPIATVKLSLQHHKNGFLFKSTTEPTIPLSWIREDLVIESSYWGYHNNFPRPTYYHYKRSNRNNLHEVMLNFDWDSQTLTTTTNGDSWKMALADKMLDKSLVQLALMEALAKGEKPFNYRVADGGQPKDYQFRETGRAILKSKLGSIEAIKILRKKAGKAADTTLWMAPSLNYLPIRIDRVRNGAVYSMLIESLSMP
jgi:hypothetical protein